MKIFDQIKKTSLLIAVCAASLTACNKLELDAIPNTPSSQETTPTLATLLDAPEFSLLKSAAVKAKLYNTLGVPTLRFTVFAPDNAAIIASLGVPDEATAAGYIASLTEAQVTGLVSYHVVPQTIPAASIYTSFPNSPNFEYPTLLNPAPSVSPLLRLSTFPSISTHGAWVNNIPIIAADVHAVNGVLHKVARLIAPPSQDLWAKINADPELTYLVAAINRADSGAAVGTRLQDALNTAVNPSAIGANLTLFAPNDAAMTLFLIGSITKALMAQGLDAATAQAQATFLVTTYGTLLLTNPAVISGSLAAALSPTTVKGLAVYHIVSSQSSPYGPPGIRLFSVNMPDAAAAVKTLLNSAGGPYAAHPGVKVQAIFTQIAPGASIVTAATVQGAGNASASNLLSFDINAVNGVIHKIDQVLLPQ